MWTRIFLLSSASLALIASSAQADGEDHLSDEHHLVAISSDALNPKVHRVRASDAFGWANYSTKVAVVSFDSEVARKMICRSQGGFSINGDRLESGPIQGRQFVSLCHLAPGTYAYRVSLRSDASDPVHERDLEGTLIVE